MIINHNLGAMNALSALNQNSNALNSALEKLSTGKKINSAADNASGYAISQKMQAQINGLDQSSQNAQDGISMIQTASGALNETTSILQNMRQLAVQASNSTTTQSDRSDLQLQFNQLASQINNIGNTTQFNTQDLLKGNGQSNLATTGYVQASTLGAGTAGAAAYMTQASQVDTISAGAAANDTYQVDLNGQNLTVHFAANSSSYSNDQVYNISGNDAYVNLPTSASTATETGTDIANALTQIINANSTLKGNYTATADNTGKVTITAVAGGQFDGAAGNTVAAQVSGTGIAMSPAPVVTAGTNVAATQASNMIDFTGANSASSISALAGKGFTVNGQEIQFYDANNGPYTGSAIAVNISGVTTDTGLVSNIVSQVGSQINGVTLSAGTSGNAGKLVLTATQGGVAGNSISYSDGGVNQSFQATFQIGANTGQTMTVNINDMRAEALGVTGSAGSQGFSQTNNVNDGTNNANVEAALDITSTTNADQSINVIDNAIQTVTTEQANLGAVQNRLQSTINNLGTSQQNLTTAQSGITDVNMAQEMSQFTQDNVLQQAAVSMLAQANQQPQLVLKLLG